MREIYAQMRLRQSPEFRDYMHAAILHCAVMIQNEPVETEYHAARVAMADKIIETNEPVVGAFVDRMVFRGVMHGPIRDTVFQEGKVAIEFADEGAVISGVLFLWNETTLAVWPSVIEDTAQ